jgi:hypothetical protein
MNGKVSMSESDGIPNETPDNLVTAEGVNERGTNDEAAGPHPGESVEVPEESGEVNDPPSVREGGADPTAPGSAVDDEHGALGGAPEPNEPG